MDNNTIKLDGNSIYKNKADLEIRREIVESNIKRLEEVFSKTNKAEIWASELIKNTEDSIVFNIEPKKLTVRLNEELINEYPNVNKNECIRVMENGIEFYLDGERFVDVRYNILGYYDGKDATHMTPTSFISVFKTEQECKEYYNKMK